MISVAELSYLGIFLRGQKMGLTDKDIISVVIPVYNKEAQLSRCLDSVLAQTYTKLEVILIDDGSSDSSAEICREYEARDERIRLICKENGGASSARNRGIEEAKGDYIGFVDADDWIEPGMYETLYDYLAGEGSGYEMAQLMSCNYTEDGQLVLPPKREDGRVEVLREEDYFRELIMHEGDSSFCTKLFRAEFIKKYRFREGHKNEDFELLLRMLPGLSKGIPTIGVAGYNINLVEQSATRGTYRQQLYEDMMYNAFTACRIARDHYPEYWEEGRRFRLVQLLDFMLHVPIEEMKKDNAFYMRMERFLKSEKKEIRKNKYLNQKQKNYLTLLAAAPVRVRKIHRTTMRIRGI